ncbi:hypothetical protein ACLB2K_017851 [Fragaria x ananassa]
MGFSTMAALTSSASKPETENSDIERRRRSSNKSEPLIPGLPDEVAELCLLYLPYPYQTLVRSVSASWNRAISDPAFLHCKKSLSFPHLFVFAFNKSTARIQWQALDPRSGRWFVLPPMPGHYSKAGSPPGLACASLPRQGMLVVLGGSDTECSMRSTLVYRTSTNQWSNAAPMPTARSYFDARCVDNKIVAVGGTGTCENDSIRTVECYDPEKDKWVTIATIPVGLTKYDSYVVGNKMYVTEGWTWPFTFSPRGLVYDSKADMWREMIPGMREGWTGVSVVVDNKLLVISEYGDCPIKVYNHNEDTWRYVSGDKFPCDALRRPFAVSAVEGSIYVVACGLNVGIGRLSEGEKGEVQVEWQVMPAPSAFRGFSPSSCQVLYA